MTQTKNKLALQGGAPVRTAEWPRWPQWGDGEREQLESVLQSGEWGGYSEVVAQFEEAFARRHQAKHGIGVANGTLSLAAALQTAGIGPGDEVIVPPYTFIATANAVQLVGATSVFVDIELETFNTLPICPTSNWQAGLTPRLAEDPIARLYRAGVPVTLNTDDLTVSDLTLSEEYVNAVESIGLTVPDVWAIDRHALDVAFADEATLAPLRASFDAWAAGLPEV
jgi:hypothetical protein